MSIILQALHKAETQRHGPRFSGGYRYVLSGAPSRRRAARRWPYWLGVCLLAGGLAGAWSARGAGGPGTAPAKPLPAAPGPVSAGEGPARPAASVKVSSGKEVRETAPAVREAERVAPAPEAAAPEEAHEAAAPEKAGGVAVSPVPETAIARAAGKEASPPAGKRSQAASPPPAAVVAKAAPPKPKAAEAPKEREASRPVGVAAASAPAPAAPSGGEAGADLEGAIRRALAVVGERPGDAAAHAALAQLYGEKRDFIPAINEYLIAIRLEPGEGGYRYELSRLYMALGSASLALRYLGESVALDGRLRGRARREPAFAPLREDPRFLALMRREGRER